jgi:hypothetical protein
MKIKKFNEINSQDDDKYPSNDKLDNMSYDEIDNIRIILLKSKIPHFSNIDNKDVRYLRELEIYVKVRFKAHEMRFAYKNIKDAKNWEDCGGDLNNFEYKNNKLISDVLSKNGVDFLFNLILKDEIDTINSEFKYINVKIPEEILTINI